MSKISKFLTAKLVLIVVVSLLWLIPLAKSAEGTVKDQLSILKYTEYCAETKISSGVYNQDQGELSLKFTTPNQSGFNFGSDDVNLSNTSLDTLNGQPKILRPQSCSPFSGFALTCIFKIPGIDFFSLFSQAKTQQTITNVNAGYDLKAIFKEPSTPTRTQECVWENKSAQFDLQVTTPSQTNSQSRTQPNTVQPAAAAAAAPAAAAPAPAAAAPAPAAAAPAPTALMTPCSDDPTSPANAKFGPCPAGLSEFEGMVENIISAVVALGFIAMLVLLVMAGFKYLTSGGEPKAIQAAHQTVTWAMLGVVFLALGWLLLQLVENFTGIKVTVLNIKILCVGPISALQFCQL